MTKRISFLFGALSLWLGGTAAVVSPEAALQRLGTQGGQATRSMADAVPRLVYTSVSHDGEPALYVFERSQTGGYMILSADDVAAPLLGYADYGSFDADSMPEQMKWWLEQYGRQIEYARSSSLPAFSDATVDATRAEERKTVAPMLKTAWNQTGPFSLMTPLINGRHTPTGCVATAMAQVMKYWEYPKRATGTGTITDPSTGESVSINLGEESLDWSSMLDSYDSTYTDEQARAVAYLMKAAGYSGSTQYDASASGAFSYLAGRALAENFGYNPKLQYCTRDYFSSAEWDELIYNEVAAGRPVLYGGQSTSVGHEFVCDGYAGDGYFHFNWGWSGMSDGYFLLTSLNPDALGTGGGLGGGFNFGQDALIGVQPEEAQVTPPYLVQYGSLSAVAFRSEITIRLRTDEGSSSWVNTGLTDIDAILGVRFTPENGSESPVDVVIEEINVPKPELVEMDGGLAMDFAGIRGELTLSVPDALKDGRYKVSVVTRFADGEWTPALCLPQYYNYFYLEKQGSKLTVETMGEASVELESGKPMSTIYYGSQTRMQIVATNSTDKDLTAGFYPYLLKEGVFQLEADGIVVDIRANSTVTKEFYVTFRAMDGQPEPTEAGEYQLVWYDPISDTLYQNEDLTVTLQVGSPAPQIAIENFRIAGVTPVATETADYGTLLLSTVVGTDEVDFQFDVINKGEHFSSPLYVALFAMGNNRAFATSLCEPVVISEQNATASTRTEMNLSELNKESIYAALVYYQSGSSMVQVESCAPIYFRLVDSAAVDGIASDDESPVRYYNLQGVEITNPVKGMLLIRQQGGKISKIIY